MGGQKPAAFFCINLIGGFPLFTSTPLFSCDQLDTSPFCALKQRRSKSGTPLRLHNGPQQLHGDQCNPQGGCGRLSSCGRYNNPADPWVVWGEKKEKKEEGNYLFFLFFPFFAKKREGRGKKREQVFLFFSQLLFRSARGSNSGFTLSRFILSPPLLVLQWL